MTEFSELFTQSAREVLPLARSKKLISYLDYRGPYLELPSSNPGLRAAIHRVLIAMTDCIDAGFVMFSAEVETPQAGRSEVIVHAAGTGTKASDETVAHVLERLELRPVQSAPLGTNAVEAFGVCPVTHGDVTFLDSGPEGLVLSLRTWISAVEVSGAEPLPDAAGVTAWLVSPVPGALDSVHRRLRRLGWRIRSFRSLEQVSEQVDLAGNAEGPRLPMLLIVAEFTGTELAEMERMATSVPAMWTVLAVLAGSPTVQARGSTSVDVRLLPLSPLELERLTAHVDWRTSTVESRETSPSPLYAEDAGLVLVVDDSAVNQLIARGQLELLGYEVAIASNGVEAIELCRAHPPDMVLMDIDMPVMDGMEATERLRACQQAGSLPPFPILAATANDDASRRKACLSAGMDGYLAKPMCLHVLADEIHRVLPTRPIALG
ncbi:response regulator [Schlegelella sp. S2-27]|uniref:Response regulator n=1 Tax=Caldimonas mangrovi TaxID=2944811 RepID=A0ABT0YHP6_9BURK|nr:response regulator [Caldimonas mangrovi]MCM5678240.1 response regulator [Caldimonas mangrovi]